LFVFTGQLIDALLCIYGFFDDETIFGILLCGLIPNPLDVRFLKPEGELFSPHVRLVARWAAACAGSLTAVS
jgi:hypothetical protein